MCEPVDHVNKWVLLCGQLWKPFKSYWNSVAIKSFNVVFFLLVLVLLSFFLFYKFAFLLLQTWVFISALPPAEWKPGIPVPPALWDGQRQAMFLPFQIPKKQQHGNLGRWVFLHQPIKHRILLCGARHQPLLHHTDPGHSCQGSEKVQETERFDLKFRKHAQPSTKG